jgi:hypothetical protein
MMSHDDQEGGGREHSALIELDSLTLSSAPDTARPTEESGLIDLRALGPFTGTGRPAPSTTTGARRARLLGYAAIGLAVVGVSTGVALVLAGRLSATSATAVVASAPDPAAGSPEVTKATPPAAAAVPVSAAAVVSSGSTAPESAAAAVDRPTPPSRDAEAARPAVARRAGAGRTIVAARRPGKTDREVDDLLRALDRGPAAPAQGAARSVASARPARTGAPAVPAKLDRTDILRVVKQQSVAIQRCKAHQPNASGVVQVRMVISRSGGVTSAHASGPLARSPAGRCVESVARRLQFPPFSGDPVAVNLPVVL